MDSRAALGAAAAVALTVTGGVSALFLTVAQAAPNSDADGQTAVTVEYVDQFGNPVPAPAAASADAASPDVVLVNPDGTPVATNMTADAGYGEGEHEEEAEHEDGSEYEDGYEEEAEYEEEGEDGEYAGAEHHEDEDHDEHEAEEYGEEAHNG